MGLPDNYFRIIIYIYSYPSIDNINKIFKKMKIPALPPDKWRIRITTLGVKKIIKLDLSNNGVVYKSKLYLPLPV